MYPAPVAAPLRASFALCPGRAQLIPYTYSREYSTQSSGNYILSTLARPLSSLSSPLTKSSFSFFRPSNRTTSPLAQRHPNQQTIEHALDQIYPRNHDTNNIISCTVPLLQPYLAGARIQICFDWID